MPMYKQIILTALLLASLSSTLYYYDRFKRQETQYLLEKERSLKVARGVAKLARLAKEIRIATYPTACDALTKEIIGEECDVGNYMEWAGPHLERETQWLLEQLRDRKTPD